MESDFKKRVRLNLKPNNTERPRLLRHGVLEYPQTILHIIKLNYCPFRSASGKLNLSTCTQLLTRLKICATFLNIAKTLKQCGSVPVISLFNLLLFSTINSTFE